MSDRRDHGNPDNETDVVGDVEAFVDYVECGKALHDWHERLGILFKECDAYLRRAQP